MTITRDILIFPPFVEIQLAVRGMTFSEFEENLCSIGWAWGPASLGRQLLMDKRPLVDKKQRFILAAGKWGDIKYILVQHRDKPFGEKEGTEIIEYNWPSRIRVKP